MTKVQMHTSILGAARQSAGVQMADLRQRYIAEAAYYKAERRGFTPGFSEQDWAEAEEEVEALLGPAD